MLVCELCDQSMQPLTVYHLVPKQQAKRKNEELGETIEICSACHRQIHALFDNKLLVRELNTADLLTHDEWTFDRLANR